MSLKAFNDLQRAKKKMVSRKKSKQRPKTWNHFSRDIYAVYHYTHYTVYSGDIFVVYTNDYSSACSVLCAEHVCVFLVIECVRCARTFILCRRSCRRRRRRRRCQTYNFQMYGMDTIDFFPHSFSLSPSLFSWKRHYRKLSKKKSFELIALCWMAEWKEQKEQKTMKKKNATTKAINTFSSQSLCDDEIRYVRIKNEKTRKKTHRKRTNSLDGQNYPSRTKIHFIFRSDCLVAAPLRTSNQLIFHRLRWCEWRTQLSS